jgi:hypothetical protein
MAKHKGVRATILSMPRAWAILFLAANSPITSSERPAADIDKAVPENARNTARIVGCMDLPNRYKLLKFYDKVLFKTQSRMCWSNLLVHDQPGPTAPHYAGVQRPRSLCPYSA